MATFDDAVELLRNPTYATFTVWRAERLTTGFSEMSGVKILNELQARGAEDRGVALALVHQALLALGGRDASYWLESKQLGGGGSSRRRQRIEVFLVPVDEQPTENG